MNANDSPFYSQVPRLQLTILDKELVIDALLPFATLGCNERRLYETLTRIQDRHQKHAGDDCHELGRQLLQIGHYRAAWPALETALYRRSRRAQSAPVDGTLATMEALLDDIVLLPGGATYLERALLVWRAVRHPMHPQIGELLNNLGYRYKHAGRLQDARTCYEEALTIWTEELGIQHAYVAAVLNNLGALERRTGNMAQARHRYRQAFAISHAVNGVDHPMTESILDGLATICRDDDCPAQHACRETNAVGSLYCAGRE